MEKCYNSRVPRKLCFSLAKSNRPLTTCGSSNIFIEITMKAKYKYRIEGCTFLSYSSCLVLIISFLHI